MVDNGERSWREQLTGLRERVLDMERRRETEKRLERERNEQSLARRLKEDTPEALAAKFAEIRRRFDREARKELADFGHLLRFYADCMKSFPKVFSPAHKTAITSLLNEMGELDKGLERQLGQWREVKTLMEAVRVRAREPSDDAALVTVAKTFSDHAHKVPLSIPSDYFARETVNFWVVELKGAPIGYVKYAPEDNALNFSIEPGGTVNFSKFIRAVLWKFCSQGPLPRPLASARVRIAYVREVKFFTDMGFVRAEVKGPSDWIYQREIN